MSQFYDCPGCGKKESCWGDRMCGECEAHYQEEQRQWEDEERQKLNARMDKCSCEDGCGQCSRDYARLLELDGRYGDAEAFMNR